MTKLESVLGDALFVTQIDFQKFKPSQTWMDTTHFHVDNEVHILLNGEALIEIDGKDVPIHAGDICLLAPQSSHYPKLCSDSLEKTNFSFNLTQNFHHGRSEKGFSEYVHYGNIFKSVKEYCIVHDEELLAIVKKLLAEEFSDENEHVFRALLSIFFITLAKRIKERRYAEKEQTIRGVSESENSFRQRKTVEEFFQKRYHEEVSIEDLAKELCLSVPHTHRVVKKVFDEGFKKTLMKQRIEHACMLIKQHDLTLIEIAYRCGYTSYNGFLSAFKSHMGETPKEYEKSVHALGD